MGYWSVTTNETVLIVVYKSWNCPIDLWYIVKSFFTRQCVSALNGRRYTICRYETDAGWAIISTMPGHSATYLEQANLNKDLDVRKTRKDQICDICRGGIDSHSPRTLRTHIGLQLGSNGQYGELKRYDCGTPGTTPHTSSDKSAGVTSLHVKVHPDSLQTHNSWKCTRPQGKSHRSVRQPGR